jgi:T5SS/PEP-CTERM-associated repeat protein
VDSQFNLAAGKMLTASNDAQLLFSGSYRIDNGTTFTINSGADLATSGFLDIASTGDGTLVVDGGESTIRVLLTSFWGTDGNTANVTLRNNASAEVGTVNLAPSTVGGTTGVINVESSADMMVGNLAIADRGGATTSGYVNITGAGSSLTQDVDATLTVGHPASGTATIEVQNGGTFTTGTEEIKINKTGTINVGVTGGGTLNAKGDVVVDGGTINGGANGNFKLAAGKMLTAANDAQIAFAVQRIEDGTTVNIHSGADFSANQLLVIGGSSGGGTLVVDGAGSTLTAGTGLLATSGNPANLVIRNNATANVVLSTELADTIIAGGMGTIRVESGADLTTGDLNIASRDGVAATGTVIVTGAGSSLVQNLFFSSLTIGNASAGAASIYVLDGGTFSTGEMPVTLNATGSIHIDGGTFNLNGPLTNNGGDIQFMSGALHVAGGIVVGTGGLLGNAVTLTPNHTLAVKGTATVDPFRTLSLQGGTLETAALAVAGTLDFRSGKMRITGMAGLTIGPGGPLGSRLDLKPEAVIQVTEAISNAGVVTGHGSLVGRLTNSATGEIRVEAGKTILFDGTGHTNSGDVRLLGGWAEFAGTLTNQATGRITGRGTLSTTGLINRGHMAFSSGLTDVFGDITNDTTAAAVGITASGNSDVTFWGDVMNTSGLFRVSNGSSATFFGGLSGTGISGGGDIFLEADVTPGSSPGLQSFGGHVHLGTLAKLEIEIGGTTKGIQYDSLAVAGAATLDGTLNVSLLGGFIPSDGDVFEILAAAGGISGTFGTTILPALSGDLLWNVVYRANAVVLEVAAPVLAGDYNQNGVVDAADYVVWRNSLGQSATDLAADGNGNGIIDAGDYDVWRAHFGSAAGSGSSANGRFGATVPEPASFLLLLHLLVGAIVGRRCRQRR